jgi:mannose-6-phosphate isomerase-like protein (cupin superfamily)
MKTELETLQSIAESILVKLKEASPEESKRLLQMNDYHGFLKSRFPEDFLSDILSPFQLTPAEVQIEIVKVDRDLSKEIHYHEASFAHCICLGEEYRVENPRGAKAYLKDSWSRVQAGDIVPIPAGTPHGFTVEEGGVLIFLSVQAPPIERDGNDDYHKIDL